MINVNLAILNQDHSTNHHQPCSLIRTGFFNVKNLGGIMQEHEKNLLLLIVIGACIGFAKLLVSDEKLTWRLTIGRTILGAATSTIAGAIILQIPDISPLALIAIASALGILGSTFIENWLKSQSTKWGVK